MKNIRNIGFAALVAVWILLTACLWFGPAEDISEAERRPLAQMPEIKAETILSGKFMGEFEDYTLDQFPLRDRFRQIKSLFHYYVLGQSDNNDIYIADGYAVKQEYPLKESSLNHAMDKFNHIYSKYLKDTGSRVVMAVVQDKGYYLAADSGHLSMDYEQLFETVRQELTWAEHVDLTGALEASAYYRTDTHWRQEEILDAAAKLCQGLGVAAFEEEELVREKIDRPFYGVYYGQAAFPMAAEELYVMGGDVLDACTVYDYETGKTGSVYDMEKLTSRDLYDVYLSGARALLKIENPNAATDRELIVFRDSFGSSMVPLLVKDYKTVTVVDIRYIATDLIGNFVDFSGQDVLLLYSTLILNSSNSLK